MGTFHDFKRDMRLRNERNAIKLLKNDMCHKISECVRYALSESKAIRLHTLASKSVNVAPATESVESGTCH